MAQALDQSADLPVPKVALAVILAWVAGGVDAIGYLVLAHLFVANMSGNTVTLGIALGQGEWATALERGLTILFWACGIAAGSLIGQLTLRAGRKHPTAVLLVVEAALLTAFMLFEKSSPTLNDTRPAEDFTFFALVALPTLAMGLQSAALRRVGQVSVRTPFVSGVLTSLVESAVTTLLQFFEKKRDQEALKSTLNSLGLFAGVFAAYLVGAVLATLLLLVWGIYSILLPLGGLALALYGELRCTVPGPKNAV